MSTRVIVLGHRGSTVGAVGARENTLVAFARAIEQGADGVELDVRLGRDGSLLINHDPEFDGRAVAEMTLEDRPASMPTLDESLDVLTGSLVNIEIKNLAYESAYDPTCAVADSVVAALVRRGGTDRVVISSFDPGTIARISELAPDIRTGLLVWFAPTVAEGIEIAVAGGHDAIHPHFDYVSDDDIDAAHRAGMAVTVWTVNATSDIEAMIERGIDGIVTDDIPTAVAVRARLEQV